MKLEFYRGATPQVILNGSNLTVASLPLAFDDFSLSVSNSLFLLSLPSFNVTAQIRAWATLDVLIALPGSGSGPIQTIDEVGLCWGNSSTAIGNLLCSIYFCVILIIYLFFYHLIVVGDSPFTIPTNNNTGNNTSYQPGYTNKFNDSKLEGDAKELCGSIGSCSVPPVCYSS